MALPSMQNVVIRGALQQVSIAYRNPFYIGDNVFPIINGLNTQTRILKYNKGPWFRISADYRAEGTTAKRGDYSLDTANIDPRQVAIGKSVTDELFFASNEPGNLPLQPIQEALIYSADQIDLFKEKLIADTIFGTSDQFGALTWADGVSGGKDMAGAWADKTSANTFVSDILAAKKSIQKATGQVPNTLIIDYATFLALQETQPILDRIKYTQTGVVTEGLIAALLQLDNVFVGKAIYNSAKETKGETVFTPLNIWEKNQGKGSAFLCYRPAAAGLRTPSVGYQYRLLWDGAWRRSISYREEWNHQTVYEVSERVQIAPLGLDLGYLFIDTILT
jgi:hypothetical protein